MNQVLYSYAYILCDMGRSREAVEIIDYLIDVISHYKITDPTFLYIRGIPTAQMVYELIKKTFVDDEVQLNTYKIKLEGASGAKYAFAADVLLTNGLYGT